LGLPEAMFRVLSGSGLGWVPGGLDGDSPAKRGSGWLTRWGLRRVAESVKTGRGKELKQVFLVFIKDVKSC